MRKVCASLCFSLGREKKAAKEKAEREARQARERAEREAREKAAREKAAGRMPNARRARRGSEPNAKRGRKPKKHCNPSLSLIKNEHWRGKKTRWVDLRSRRGCKKNRAERQIKRRGDQEGSNGGRSTTGHGLEGTKN